MLDKCNKGHIISLVGRYKDGHCKTCQKKSCKEYVKRHPDVRRNAVLKNTFGITLSEWNVLFSSQNGICLGCYRHQSSINSRFEVDHDHATGKIRGLLCKACNLSLGLIQDSTSTLRRLADYLDNFAKVK